MDDSAYQIEFRSSKNKIKKSLNIGLSAEKEWALFVMNIKDFGRETWTSCQTVGNPRDDMQIDKWSLYPKSTQQIRV